MTTEEKVNEAGVLVLLAHPTLQTSWVNRRLMGEAEAMDGVSVHDLYQQYPDFDVVVEQEQSLLEASHTVVMQFPFF